MSDTSQGEGWWLASDGKWYPPSSTPAPASAPPTYGQPNGYAPAAVAPTSNEAIWSLVLGILSVTCLGLLAGIPAVILGTIGKRKIGESGGALRGQGLATAGLVLGWVSIGFSVLIFLFVVLGAIAGSGSSGALGL